MGPQANPFVTCLCLTRDRRQWLPKAITCFQTQTHRNAELLILSDGQDVQDLLPVDPRIRLIHLDTRLSIGSKRNFGCSRADGTIVAHWDDDDHCEPNRLSDQLARMDRTGKAVTGYYAMRFTDGDSWWRYTGNQTYSLGTSLVYRLEWWDKNRFADVQVGEDNQFVAAASGAGELATEDAGEMMYATIHAGNTSPRNLDAPWQRIG